MKLKDPKKWEDYKVYIRERGVIGDEIIRRLESFANTLETHIENLEDYTTWDEALIKVAAVEHEFMDDNILGHIIKDLTAVWVHGDELRKWFNSKYKYDGPGVANPHYNAYVRDMAPPPPECEGLNVRPVLKAMFKVNPFTGEFVKCFIDFTDNKKIDSIYFDDKNDKLYVTMSGVTRASSYYEFFIMLDEKEAQTL